MNDRIVRALSTKGGIRILACSTNDLTRTILALQGTSPTAGIALARGLAGGALMGSLLKSDQRIALKFEGNGPLRKLIVEADADGAVRGCVANPAADVPPRDSRWDVPGLIGRAGFLTVSRDIGTGSMPYQGMVQLQTSEIGADLAYYLTESEQIPSAVGVGASLDDHGVPSYCGGFLVQALPKADEAEIETIMANIAGLPPLTELLKQGPEGLLASVAGDIPYTLLETRELFFRCGCNRPKVQQALLALSPTDLREMIEHDGGAEVSCEFCRQTYSFDAAELESLEKERAQ